MNRKEALKNTIKFYRKKNRSKGITKLQHGRNKRNIDLFKAELKGIEETEERYDKAIEELRLKYRKIGSIKEQNFAEELKERIFYKVEMSLAIDELKEIWIGLGDEGR